jgi:hypothetical protein
MATRPPDTTALFTPSLDFPSFASHLWEYQRHTNPVIRQYCDLLNDTSRQFIPIRFFKDFDMRCGEDWTPEAIFRSSGTTGQVPSRHLVRDLSLYHESLLQGFHHCYPPRPYAIFALLPSYLERGDSSLVHMVRKWIGQFGLPGSGFFLDNFQAMHQGLTQAMERNEPILLIGVSFALLDFVETHSIQLPASAIVMETGGMKGRREELARKELHHRLQQGFGQEHIHSEYGMTELLSQAYARQDGRFHCPPWMQVTITDPANPTHILPHGEPGRINIIDLANVHSCAFIATDDYGLQHPDLSFEIIGRLEGSELRGCNLMYV